MMRSAWFTAPESPSEDRPLRVMFQVRPTDRAGSAALSIDTFPAARWAETEKPKLVVEKVEATRTTRVSSTAVHLPFAPTTPARNHSRCTIRNFLTDWDCQPDSRSANTQTFGRTLST
jgi:hypothetical protein